MTQRGGKREGAGRRKAARTIAKEQMREYLIERVRAEMKPIVDAQIALALGVKVAGEDGIYEKAPDKDAIKYLLDQTIGKARESLDLKHSGVVAVSHLERLRRIHGTVNLENNVTDKSVAGTQQAHSVFQI